MQFPVPVAPARRFLPAADEVAQRTGVTVSVMRRRGRYTYAVVRTVGATVTAEECGSLEESAAGARLSQLVRKIGVAVRHVRSCAADTIYCDNPDLGHGVNLAEVLGGEGLGVSTAYPPAAGIIAAGEAAHRQLDAVYAHLVISTDASCGRRSGWIGQGWVLDFGHGTTARLGARAVEGRSVLEGELRAIRLALHAAHAAYTGTSDGRCDVLVRSDSQIALRMIEQPGWAPPGATPLCAAEVSRIRHHVRFATIRFEWVKAHDGDRANELADRLAVFARRAQDDCLSLAEAHRIAKGIRADAAQVLERSSVMLAA